MRAPYPIRLEVSADLARSIDLERIATRAADIAGPAAALEWTTSGSRVLIACSVVSGQAIADAVRDCAIGRQTARDVALECAVVLRRLSRLLDRAVAQSGGSSEGAYL